MHYDCTVVTNKFELTLLCQRKSLKISTTPKLIHLQFLFHAFQFTHNPLVTTQSQSLCNLSLK